MGFTKAVKIRSFSGVIISAIVLNVILGIIPLWRCYANNYLHWGALTTWLLLLIQGCFFYGLSALHSSNIGQSYGEAMVWYHMFIIFVMYCMLPVPVKWCTVACLLTAFTHVLMVGIIVRTNDFDPIYSVYNVFSIGLIHIGKLYLIKYTFNYFDLNCSYFFILYLFMPHFVQSNFLSIQV